MLHLLPHLRRALFWLPVLLGGGLLVQAILHAQGIEKLYPWPDAQAGRAMQHVAGGIALLAAGFGYRRSLGFREAHPAFRLLRAAIGASGSVLMAVAVSGGDIRMFLVAGGLLVLPLLLQLLDPDPDEKDPVAGRA